MIQYKIRKQVLEYALNILEGKKKEEAIAHFKSEIAMIEQKSELESTLKLIDMLTRSKKPIIWFDCETTGVETDKDRIVQIACVKHWLNDSGDLEREEKNFLINPSVKIPESATEIHSISNEDVADAPKFKNLAKGIAAYFEGCDIGGFNIIRFDLLILIAEMERAGVYFDISNAALVDVMQIENKITRRNLSQSFARHVGGEIENAHDALADVEATIATFLGQWETLEYRFKETNADLASKFPLDGNILDYSSSFDALDQSVQGENKRLDLAGKLYRDENKVLRFGFGGKKDEAVLSHLNYVKWMNGQNFPTQTMKIINREFQSQRQD